MYKNKTITCCDCQTAFVFSQEEQKYYAEKGLTNMPRRCHNCRVLNKAKLAGRPPESTHLLNCSKCGQLTRISFAPNAAKPIYCRPCLAKQGYSVDSAGNGIVAENKITSYFE